MESEIASLNTRLTKIGTRLDELVAKADSMGKEIPAEHREDVDGLQKHYKDVQSKVAQGKTATAETWVGIKAGAETAFTAFEDASKRLRIPGAPPERPDHTTTR